MDRRVFNEDGDPSLLLVLGFGERLDGGTVRWFLDRPGDAGYRIHAVQLPTDATEFGAASRDPVQGYHDTHDPAAVIGHSLGGLVATHLETTARRVYLAPWWGIYGEKLLTWKRRLVLWFPTEYPLLSIGSTREDIGTLLTDEEWERLPKRLPPAFVAAVYRAQQRRPPIEEGAVVFVSLRDTVVSLAAIGEAVSPDQIRRYEGGHQPYASAARRRVTDDIVAALP